MILPFGIPKLFVCYSGKEFKNREFASMIEKVGSTVHYTTVGRHQSNGQVERFNRTLKDWLSKQMVDDNVNVNDCILTYNNTVKTIQRNFHQWNWFSNIH